MEYHTSYHLHLKIMTFWNRIGISPIHVIGITRSKTESLSSKHYRAPCNTITGGEENRSQPILNLNITPSQENPDICKFPIYKLGSFRHSSRPIFWFMLIFFYSTLFYAVVKLVLFLRSTSVQGDGEGADVVLKDRDTARRTPFIVGSILWSLYCATCCAGYFVHFLKPEKLCKLAAKWQIVEGELISESRAMKASGESVESYLKKQRRGMISFSLMMPISYIFFGIGTTYYDSFPMNMYSSVPREWGLDRPWIKPLCYTFSWMQVGIFLICESQTELFSLAFTRTLMKCLKILNKPAIEFYAQYRQQDHKFAKQHYTICTENFQNLAKTKKLEMLEIFHDSVERFERLKNLSDDFNDIFRWGLFLRKGCTMIKVCCYVYLLLRHAGETGFPGAFFLYAAFAIFLKFGIILSTMGAVRVESEIFLKEWKKVLLVMFPNKKVEEERKLKCCNPFGFRMGFFYVVNSSTILTFCSVVLTYLIILLQLQFY